MGAPILQAYGANVSIVVNKRIIDAHRRSNALLEIEGLNLTRRLPHLRAINFKAAELMGHAQGCAKSTIPFFAHPFTLASTSRGGGSAPGYADVYPKMAYWPFFEAVDDLETSGAGAGAASVVFIRRQGPMFRALEGEERLLAHARALPWKRCRGFNFQIVNESDFSGSLASRPLVGLIGISGGSLAKSYRMRPGSVVVEIIPPKDPPLGYAAVAKGRQLRHHAFVASSFPWPLEMAATSLETMVRINQTAFLAFLSDVFRLGNESCQIGKPRYKSTH